MKKTFRSVLILIVIVGGSAAAYISLHKSKAPVLTSTTKSLKACEVLTLNDAKTLLGTSAKADSSNGANDNSNTDEAVTDCFYSSSDASLSNSANLTLHIPLTATGSDKVASQYKSARSAQAETKSGYGDQAYYDPFSGKFNILKDGVWVSISSGGSSADSLSFDRAQKVADLVLTRVK